MKKYKKLKDPIYGYVQIPHNYIVGIIDTAPFQRLRRIIQTSYSPLYSSAVHNRFVHSIGVYHLGDLAALQMENEINAKFKDCITFDLERYRGTFQLACLLHDVGHAPFSHTGEKFYLEDEDDNKYNKLHTKLIEFVPTDSLKKDIPVYESDSAAPHEIMSAIVGLSQYKSFFNNIDEQEFFIRCITGYKYSNKTLDNDIKNCFISLLNSKIIDVDKLDYLIRDAYITGFDTVRIDYERLLSSLTISKNKHEIGYYKGAISVIENVVYAHDAERKWIQSHPVVLYESYILQHIITNVSEHINGLQSGDSNNKTMNHKLFSFESLSDIGQEFDNGIKIALLCDDDIIFLMKNMFMDKLSKEYFNRNLRRHPIWKSEAEYKAFFLSLINGGEALESLEKALDITAAYLDKNIKYKAINKEVINNIEKEINQIESENIARKTKEVQLKDKKLILKVMKSLESYADSKEMECNFVILAASQFGSNFGKPDFSKINIVFKMPEEEKIAEVGNIVSSFEAKVKDREKFFYIFYKRKDSSQDSPKNNDIDNAEICNKLFQDIAFN